MARFQFLISQQDNYNGESNCVDEFINKLILDFVNEKYMYIIHDKETDLHIHTILILEKAMTKKELLFFFPKADIQVQRASNKKAYEYLYHKNHPDKYQYSLDDIKYNNIDNEYLEKWLKESNQDKKENEILDEIVNDILNGEITTFQECIYKYKGVALKYSKSIREVLILLN